MTPSWKSVILAVSAFASGGAATAQDPAPGFEMLEEIFVDPAKLEQFRENWIAVRDIAQAEGYPFSTQVMASANRMWLVTPVSGFADIDRIRNERTVLREAGGAPYQTAIAQVYDATISTETVILERAPDFAYQPENDPLTGAAPGYVVLSVYAVKAGERDAAIEAVKAIKAINEAAQAPYGYDVRLSDLGIKGFQIVLITYGADPIDHAERTAQAQAALAQNTEFQTAFRDFIALTEGYQEVAFTPMPALALNGG
ncbi:MAG: hypothetical protein ACFB2Z_07635 [Maricaulaceae bacterium]